MKHYSAMLAICAAMLLSACGGGTMYAWGGYNYALLNHYKDATDSSVLAEDLQKIVEKAEAKDAVPPGLYAELGFAYLDAGNEEQALYYIAKEHEMWPESRAFLDSALQNLQSENSQSSGS